MNYLKILIPLILITLIYKYLQVKDRKNANKLDNDYLHIIICATHDNEDYKSLTSSLTKHGYKYTTICWGKEWKGSGYGMRMTDTLNYINNHEAKN